MRGLQDTQLGGLSAKVFSSSSSADRGFPNGGKLRAFLVSKLVFAADKVKKEAWHLASPNRRNAPEAKRFWAAASETMQVRNVGSGTKVDQGGKILPWIRMADKDDKQLSIGQRNLVDAATGLDETGLPSSERSRL